MKHTPGKWMVDTWEYPTAKPPRKELAIQTESNRIAIIDWDEGENNPYTIPNEEAMANAALIAAAPLMYDALKLVIDNHVPKINPLSDAAILSAKAALSKAEGI